MDEHRDHFIDGTWKTGEGTLFNSINPATGTIVWRGHAATQKEVKLAISSARTAFESWSLTATEERIKILENFTKEVQNSANFLAETISKEVGKPLWEAKTEVAGIASKTAATIEAYHKRCAEVVRDLAGGTSITRHRPHGVVAVFGPFNFPGHLPNGHIVPAILAGNTVVFKPSELTPSIAEELMKCWKKAGLPKGVINLIQGGRDTGKILSTESGIDGVFFTGSWETGRILSELYAKTPEKILALELGGNNPLIVTDLKNFKEAAWLTIQSTYLTSGQRCSCARRLIVPEGKEGDEFIKVLAEMIKGIQVGPYTQSPEPYMGPLVSQHAASHVLAAYDILKSRGGVPLVEMHLAHVDTALLSPGLIDVTHVSVRPDEEIFGPLLQLIRVKDFDAAIAEANNTNFGLTAGLFSSSKEKYEKFYQKIRAGVITWNAPMTGASGPLAPFGGIKRSGNHRPSGFYAIDYCAYPVASLESPELKLPAQMPPGINSKLSS